MVAPRVPLTEDHDAVRAVLGTVEPDGDTAAIDGTYVAMMSAQAAEGRPLVVVFTDGIDTASWMSPEELIDATRRASAVIYTVATGDARRWTLLNDLADATGGRAIALASSKDLRAEFERILTEFRSRYLLAFTPKGVAESGYHRLTVRATRSGINVKARPGYTAVK
jgi:VWFA-related protein